MFLFNRKNKYQIDKKRNIPQLVYGIPDYKRNETVNSDSITGTNIFCAYYGKKGGQVHYYYVNKNGDKYQFLYGHIEKNEIIKNDINDPNIVFTNKEEKCYNMMIQELSDVVSEWNEKYSDENNNDNDVIQWNINFIEKNKIYSGINSFPDNYDKAMKIIQKYFEELMNR